LIVLVLVVALAVSVVANAAQFIANQQLSNTNLGEANIYYKEFGVIPSANVNSSFNPPISMYHALQIGLESEGWNRTSLEGMRVGISLVHGEILTNESQPWATIGGAVTSPPASYSAIYDVNATYLYLWEITVEKAQGFTTPPSGFVLVDAASGEVIPNPPLY